MMPFTSSSSVLVEPVDRVGAADGFEHGGQPGGQVGARRNAERDTGVADAAFGSDETLRHSGGLRGEGVGDARGVEAEHDLEHQRGAYRGIERRVSAGEQQLEPLVGDRAQFGFGDGSCDVVAQW